MKDQTLDEQIPKGSPEKQVTHVMEQKHPASAFSQLQWMLHYQMVN